MDLKTEIKSLSIVIPVYNSKDTIENLVDELIIELHEKYLLEIVLVNDYSKDNSEEICIRIHKKYPSIVSFYSLSRNVGEHNAVMAGLNNSTGNYVVIMDDDFQNPVGEVVKMVNYAKEQDYDVVYSFYDKKRHSFFRNFGSAFNNKVANLMLQKPKDLYLSSFKVLNKFTVDEIVKYTDPFPYIDGLIFRVTGNIGKLRVDHHERKKGHSGYTFKKLTRLWLNMFVNFSILPLRISIFLGFIFATIGFIIGIDTVFERLNHPDIPHGYAFTMVIISLFSGIQLISIGMVGEYLGRLFLSQNKQPQYTIKKRFKKTVSSQQ
jgi:glycosyltransferase involved in cell wall biosynthesis